MQYYCIFATYINYTIDAMTKKELRKLYLNKRLSLTDKERSRLDDLLLIQLQKAPLPDTHLVLNYLPIAEKAEPNTYLFSHYLHFIFPELQIAYPVCDFEKGSFKAILTSEETEFRKSVYNIIEPISGDLAAPQSIDLVFVPLLICDKKGYRVGYGKGMYDKYLQMCRKDVVKVGFSYFNPLDSISDIDENDIPLDVLITPENIYQF
jgi:5-formyltetrahydrofolate cyclo-ligase